MSGRHPFHELSGGFTAERRKRIDAIKSKLLAEMSTDAADELVGSLDVQPDTDVDAVIFGLRSVPLAESK